MATRQIKDAKDLTTNELIYFKGHAQATYMSDGRTVEDAILAGISSPETSVDLSNYATKTELDQKQDRLISGTTIKTINNTSLLGSGNISISGGGTITAVQANGTSVATSGVANIPAATTSRYGVTKLSSSTSSTSTSLAATASAVKSVYDLAYKKQDKLTSGTNIKTINGQSILGSGDLGISSGNGKSLQTFSGSSVTLTPNIYYRYYAATLLSSLTVALATPANTSILNEYFMEFTTSSSGTTISFPASIKWANGIPPMFEANTTYQVSIVNNLGIVTKFA
jgi:hypothetical protein